MIINNAAGNIKAAGNRLLSLLYPHTCPFCGALTKESVCSECAVRIRPVAEPRCKKCGKPVNSERQEYCYDCTSTRHSYDRGFGLWLHQGQVKKSIYHFKYDNHRIYSQFYAEQLAENYGTVIRQWNIDLIIPIPLYKKRRRQRGYNQAELVAKKLGQMLSVPVDSKSLKRIRNTAPQKKMEMKKRKSNLLHAFAVKKEFIPVSNVLLIDDIYTTGNTVSSAASALKLAGVQKVYFLTISIGQGN